MSQSHIEVHSSVHRTHARVPQQAAQIPIRTRASTPEHAVVQDASSTPQAVRGAPLHMLHTRRFVVALWCSVLLFVAGLGLLHHSSAPDGALLFLLGTASLTFAAALFRSARSRLLAHLECEAQKEGLSASAAQQRAHTTLERVMLSPQAASLPRESSDATERLLDKYPLA